MSLQLPGEDPKWRFTFVQGLCEDLRLRLNAGGMSAKIRHPALQRTRRKLIELVDDDHDFIG